MNACRMLAIACVVATLASCARTDAAGAEAPPPSATNEEALAPAPFDPTALADREWWLVALPGPDEVAVPPGTSAMLRFEPQPDGSWQASGHGPCNQLSSPVAFAGDAMEFLRIQSTKRACAELALESAWFERMRAGKGQARLSGARLEISRDGNLVMVFEAKPAG
jgi:heat shock protein HslJ